MPRRVPNITKIRELIGFEPRVPLDEIIRRVVQHMHVELQAGR
jgi:nucleoside-diphosphate-sugar epimerase